MWITFPSAAAILLTVLVAAADPPKVPRLGYLSPGDIAVYDNSFLQGLQDEGYIVPGEVKLYDAAFWQTLVKRGYFEGQRIRIEVRATGMDFERAPELAADLVRSDVDIIFAIPAIFAKAAQRAVRNANKSTPIVFGPEFDPVGSGFVTSLAKPGGNMTGLGMVEPEFEAKRLELLKETFPRVSHVAYLTSPKSYRDYFSKSTPVMKAAARKMGIRLQTFEANTAEELKDVLSKIARSHADSIVLPFAGLFLTERKLITDFVAMHRLPTIYGDALFVEEGGLMAYGVPFAAWKRHAASLVAKILKGANPADIAVEQPTNFRLIINMKTAQALGLSIPNEIVSRADQVIR